MEDLERISTNKLIMLKKPNKILEKILEDAPKEAQYYETRSNGFDLENGILRIGYTRFFDAGSHFLDLWFLQTNPKIRVGGIIKNIENLSKSVYCFSIWAHVGDTYTFVEGEMGDTLRVYRMNSGFGDIGRIIGSEEWFDRGTELLQKAIKKYNVRYWYDMYMRRIWKTTKRNMGHF